ncbi:MAG: peptide ABC transporter substrate-binding protein [Candidatus Eremiobacteraeota bacterium]|nr:peptide ABC transporter substrate-binding protein [Candidatus Eremiobacteraeota bacterium]
MRFPMLLAALMLLAGCSLRPVLPARDRLQIVQTQDFPTLDPIFVSGVGGQELAALLYSYLVKIDDRGRLVPDAAEAVPSRENGGISPDGRTITYRLRPDVRFADGSRVTSFDVAETIGRIAFPGSDVPTRVAYDDVEAVTTPDSRTVRVLLRQPYAPIVLYLCGPGNATPILPWRVIHEHAHLRGTSLDDAPLGSGPYMVRRWQRGDRLELVPNPYYYAGPAHISALSIRIVSSATTALQMLRSGEADAYVNADDAQYDDLRALAATRTEMVPIDGTGALIFNTRDPRLSDARVRRAIVSALDIRSIVSKSLLGERRDQDPGRGLFQWAYDPKAYAMPRFDLRAAQRMLDLAGWHRGSDGVRRRGGVTLALDFLVRADKPSALIMATQMQAEAKAAGVSIAIRELAIGEFVAPNGPLYGGRFQVALFPFVNGFDPDVRDQFGCYRIPPHGFNKPRYCNPRLNPLMAAAVVPYDRASRTTLYHKVESMLAQDLPMAALYQAVSINTFPAALQNEHAAVTTPFWNVGDWTF